MLIGAMLCCAFVSMLLIMKVVARPFSALALFSWLFILGVLVRGGVLAIRDEVGLIGVSGQTAAAQVGSLTSALFSLSGAAVLVLVGYALAIRARATAAISQAIANRFCLRPLRNSEAVLLVTLAVAGVTAFFLVSGGRFGGAGAFVNALYQRTSSTLEGHGYASVAVDVVVIIALYAFYSRLVGGQKGPSRSVAAVAVASAVATLLLTGGRGAVAGFLLSLMVLAWSNKRKKIIAQWAAISLLLLVTAFVAVVGLAMRQKVQSDVSQIAHSVVTSPVDAVLSSVPLVDSYGLTVAYTSTHGFDLGAQYLSYISRPVPRALWASKPELVGFQIRQEFWGDRLTGIPPTVFGEFYFSFGILGLALGSALFGVLLAVTDLLKDVRRGSDRTALVLHAAILPCIAITSVRSGLEMGSIKAVVILFLIYAIGVALRLRMSRSGEALAKGAN